MPKMTRILVVIHTWHFQGRVPGHRSARTVRLARITFAEPESVRVVRQIIDKLAGQVTSKSEGAPKQGSVSSFAFLAAGW